MQYTVRHLTRFTYENPISESIMEVRMQPRTEALQRCLGFELSTTPRATVTAYRDSAGNVVHHFDIPGRHGQLSIVAEAVVEFVGAPSLPGAHPTLRQVSAPNRRRSAAKRVSPGLSPVKRSQPRFICTLSKTSRPTPTLRPCAAETICATPS